MIDSLPLHPMLVHFVAALLPLAVCCLLLSHFFADLKDLKKVGACLLAAALPAAIIALWSGEEAAEQVWNWFGSVEGARQALHEHEEAAELIPWLIALALGGWWAARLLEQRWRFGLRLITLLPALVILLQASHLGGALVYKYNAAQAYQPAVQNVPVTDTTAPAQHDEDMH